MEEKRRQYYLPVNIGSDIFMTSQVDVVYPKCKCTDVDGQLANEWKKGFSVYRSLMYEVDRKEFDRLLDVMGYQKDFKCIVCHNKWMKDIGNKVKVAGSRFSHIFTFFLDMYAMSNWTTYDDSEVVAEAQRYAQRADDEMLNFLSDDQISEDVNRFLSAHCSFVEAQTPTLNEWLVGRMWANHGTAKDEDDEMSFLSSFIVKDKAALAYAMTTDILEIPDVLENKVFPKRDRKNRIIVVGPTNEYILGSYVNRVAMDRLETRFFKVSNTKRAPDVVEAVTKQIMSGDLCLPIDQSAFDLNQRKAAIVAARNWLVRQVSTSVGKRELLTLAENREEIIIHERLDKPLQWHNGLMSGKWYTSIVGSLLNAWEVWKSNGDSWFGINEPTLHQGDDTQMTVKDLSVVQRILENAKKFNIPINPTKNFLDRYRTDYLHRMYLAGPARVQFGDMDMNKRVQILSYPARSITAWVWGDQDHKDLSTTESRQSQRVAKTGDRIHTIGTRLNHFNTDILFQQSKLSEIEWAYLTTPEGLGGLGATYLKRGGSFYKSKGGGRNNYYHLIEGFGGYDNAVVETERQFGVRFEYNQVMGLIEGTMKYKQLPESVRANLKKDYYDIIKVEGKALEKPLLLKDVFTRNVNVFQSKLPQQPFLSQRPLWTAAASLLIGQERFWDAPSLMMKTRLARAGRYVVRLWEKGEISISKRYSRQLNPELLSPLAEGRTQQLLIYLSNHTGRDILPWQLQRMELELNKLLDYQVAEQEEMWATF